MKKITLNDLHSLAFDEVKKMILTNQLRPGEKIIQEKLAGDLGISRTPLRGALQMLEGEGLVLSVPRKGIYVRSFSDQDIVDIYDCRVALECQAIQLFTVGATDKAIQAISTLFDSFKHRKKIEVKRYQKADRTFHLSIIDGCKNDFLAKLFHKSNLIFFIDRIGLVRPPEETLAEHFDIIKAIQNRNPEKARKRLKEHLEHSQKLIQQRIHKQA